jgi:hypothetical protein
MLMAMASAIVCFSGDNMFSDLGAPVKAISVYRPHMANPVAKFGGDAELEAIRAELAERGLFGQFFAKAQTHRGHEDTARVEFAVDAPDEIEPDDLERAWEVAAQTRYERAADKEIEASEHRASARSAQRIAQAEAESAALRVRVEMLEAERAEWRTQAEATIERLTRRAEREREDSEHSTRRAHENEVRRLERALETLRSETDDTLRASKFRAQMELEYLTREVTELRELKRTLSAAVEAERAERYAERMRAQEDLAKARADVSRAKAQSETHAQLELYAGMSSLLKDADPEVRPMLTQAYSAQLGVPVHEPTGVEKLLRVAEQNPEVVQIIATTIQERFPGLFGSKTAANVAASALPSRRL